MEMQFWRLPTSSSSFVVFLLFLHSYHLLLTAKLAITTKIENADVVDEITMGGEMSALDSNGDSGTGIGQRQNSLFAEPTIIEHGIGDFPLSTTISPFAPSSHSPELRPSISVECIEEQQMAQSGENGAATMNVWECAIEEEVPRNMTTNGNGIWEADGIDDAELNEKQTGMLEKETSGSGGKSLNHSTEEFEEQQQFVKGDLHIYYSHKINRTNGRLFISAQLQWHFHIPHPASADSYMVRIWSEENNGSRTTNKGNNKDDNTNSNNHSSSLSAAPSMRIFSIPLRRMRNSSSTRPSSSIAKEMMQFNVHLDNVFTFGRSYQIKIAAFVLTVSSTAFAVARKNIHFLPLVDDPLDTSACSSTGQQSSHRQELASRWTGAFRTLSFFPLHSAVNVTFFGAPPSHCIPGYRLQLWLLNSLMEEKIVQTDSLIRHDVAFVGSAEFRRLMRAQDEQIEEQQVEQQQQQQQRHPLKYRLVLAPIEHGPGGKCVCVLYGKCECIQVHSDSFMMPRPNSTDVAQNVFPTPPPTTDSERNGQAALFPSNEWLACGLLALTLTFCLLFVVLRRRQNAKNKQRHRFTGGAKTLLRKRPVGEETGGLIGSPATNCSPSSFSPAVRSVLLLNAQPAKRAQLERFARLLVKNGVRVFYDQWDRTAIERNLLLWVQHATSKADKTVIFYDLRAEALVLGQSMQKTVRENVVEGSDLFDRVFLALYQQLDLQRTIFVKWDDGNGQEVINMPSTHRPIGCLSENVLLFRRDLRLIYSALKVPFTEQEVRDIQVRNERETAAGTATAIGKALTVRVPTVTNKYQQQQMENNTMPPKSSEQQRGGTTMEGAEEEERVKLLRDEHTSYLLTIKQKTMDLEKGVEEAGKQLSQPQPMAWANESTIDSSGAPMHSECQMPANADQQMRMAAKAEAFNHKAAQMDSGIEADDDEEKVVIAF